MTAHNGYSNIPGFGLYDTTGTTEDWSFWSTGGLGFTFEIGPSEFHPPYETGVVAEYEGLAPAAGAGLGGNREAYYEMLAATADSALHSVLTGVRRRLDAGAAQDLPDRDVAGVRGRVLHDRRGSRCSSKTRSTSSMVTTGGTFAWHTNPSTRPEVAGRFGRDGDRSAAGEHPAREPARCARREHLLPLARPERRLPVRDDPVRGPGTARRRQRALHGAHRVGGRGERLGRLRARPRRRRSSRSRLRSATPPRTPC